MNEYDPNSKSEMLIPPSTKMNKLGEREKEGEAERERERERERKTLLHQHESVSEPPGSAQILTPFD